MQTTPRLIAVSTISALVLLTGMTYEVVHLIGRIAALEIAVATAHQIAQTASSEVAELQAATRLYIS